MSLQSKRELENTQEKLRVLQNDYDSIRSESGEDDDLRQAELDSLRRLINQLKEEIARYEAHQPAR